MNIEIYPFDNIENYIKVLIQNAIAEDIGDGDHTSLSCIPVGTLGKVQLLVKEDGILAGVDIAQKVLKMIDPKIEIEKYISNGAKIQRGDVAFRAEGDVISLLQAERLVLNIMQRMSGIATQTSRYVQKLEGTKTKILDTRKTTPGMRLLEKLAVKTGGGENHRMGLFDMILIKDNHIDFAGGIENAIKKANKYLREKNKQHLKIEIETRNIDEIKKVINTGGVHRILIDNFSVGKTREAVELINGQFETESSGGITIDTIRDYALCGVDYISIGALTHQIKSLDLSLKALDD